LSLNHKNINITPCNCLVQATRSKEKRFQTINPKLI
jgi:hypothetical protein